MAELEGNLEGKQSNSTTAVFRSASHYTHVLSPCISLFFSMLASPQGRALPSCGTKGRFMGRPERRHHLLFNLHSHFKAGGVRASMAWSGADSAARTSLNPPMHHLRDRRNRGFERQCRNPVDARTSRLAWVDMADHPTRPCSPEHHPLLPPAHIQRQRAAGLVYL